MNSVSDVISSVNYKNHFNRPADSIEFSEGNTVTNNSIELPKEITDLVTGTDYWKLAKTNRYKKLWREGHDKALLFLADYARKATRTGRADCFFAKMCSKANWEGTLKWVKKAMQVAQNAVEVARRIKATPAQMKPVFKACWRLGDSVIRQAVTAQETGRNKFKYFCWLTSSNTCKSDRGMV